MQETYAAFAQKYGVACADDFVDSSLCRAVDNEKTGMPPNLVRRLSTESSLSDGDSSENQQGWTVDGLPEDSFLYKCSRLVAKFGLETAKETNNCTSKK